MHFLLNRHEYEDYMESKESKDYLEKIKENAEDLVKTDNKCLRKNGHSYCDDCIIGRMSWWRNDNGYCLAGLEMGYSK